MSYINSILIFYADDILRYLWRKLYENESFWESKNYFHDNFEAILFLHKLIRAVESKADIRSRFSVDFVSMPPVTPNRWSTCFNGNRNIWSFWWRISHDVGILILESLVSLMLETEKPAIDLFVEIERVMYQFPAMTKVSSFVLFFCRHSAVKMDVVDPLIDWV